MLCSSKDLLSILYRVRLVPNPIALCLQAPDGIDQSSAVVLKHHFGDGVDGAIDALDSNALPY
jgi:hypothetical protein